VTLVMRSLWLVLRARKETQVSQVLLGCLVRTADPDVMERLVHLVLRELPARYR